MTAGALTIADQSLVVFVDDTGHEALSAVFHGHDPKRVSFMEVARVEKGQSRDAAR